MKQSRSITCLKVALLVCFLSVAHAQPVTSIYGTDAQKDGIVGAVKERVSNETLFLEAGKSTKGETETIRYDEQGRRLYYYWTRLDVEKWSPSECSWTYEGTTGRVDNRDGEYNLLAFDENGRLKEVSTFSASDKLLRVRRFTYSRTGKPKALEYFDASNKPTGVLTYTENDDGTLTRTNGAMKSVYNASGVLIIEEIAYNGKTFQKTLYDEYGNPTAYLSGYCPETSAADAKEIPTSSQRIESGTTQKDSQGRIMERECLSHEQGDVIWYDASMRVVAERSFGKNDITSTRNTLADDGKILKTETETVSNHQATTSSSETFAYDEQGRIKTMISTDSSGEHTANYLYRSDGKLAKVIQGSRSEYYSYGKTGLLIAKTTISTDTENPPDSHNFSIIFGNEAYSYYDNDKTRSQKTTDIIAFSEDKIGDSDIAITFQTSKEFEYDAQGRCCVEKRVDFDGSTATVYYRYDSEGRLSAEVAITASSDGRAYEEKEYAYERDNGFLKRTEYRNVSRERYRYAYDEKGNVTSKAVSRMLYDGTAYVETPQSLTKYSYVYY